MPIDVICPKCQSKLRAPDEVIGKYVRCKKCQEKFKVPNPGIPVDSVGDTQQLSVFELPKSVAPPAPVAKPHVVAAPVDEPMMLDDSAFEEPIPAVLKVPAVLKPAAPLPLPDEDEEKPKKKKRRDEDDEEDEDRPKKKKKRDDDDEDDEEDRPKKKQKEKPLIGGEPTFAMPGAMEDPAPAYVPPPVHATQFSFEAPGSIVSKPGDEDDDRPKSKKKRDDDDADDDERPKKRKKRDDDEDDTPKKGEKKPPKSKKLLYILGGLAVFLFLGCAGAAAAAYFLVYKAADAITKATFTTGATPTKKDGPGTRPTKPTTPTTDTTTPMPAGPVVTPFTMPALGAAIGPILVPGTVTPLPFSPDSVKQFQGFNHLTEGPMLLAVYQSQLGFNGVGAEDTVVRYDIAKAKALEFIVPADRIVTPRILDVSDSGDRVAIEAPAGRLTVYDFTTKSKVFDGLDIFAGLPQREGIVAIAFGDAAGSTVAVVDKFGAVDVWDIKERQRLVTGTPDPQKLPVAVGPRKPGEYRGLIAGKGYLKTVHFKTGQFSQEIRLPAKTGLPLVVAGQVESSEPSHTAIVHLPDGATDREILVVDKQTTDKPGQTATAVWRIPLPAAAGVPKTLRWIEADRVLVLTFEPATSLLMLDFKEKTPVVYLRVGQEKTLLNATGMLVVMPNPKIPGKAALLQATIPGNSFNALMDTAKVNKVPEPLFVKPDGLSR